MAGLEAIPPAKRWIVATENMAKLLRAQAKLAEANEIERGVMSRVTGRQGAKTYGAFIADKLENEKEADERLMPLRKRIQRDQTSETVETTTRQNLEVMKNLQWTVNGGEIEFSLGRSKLAFTDTGEQIITANGSSENEERATLLVAARKFDNFIRIDGCHAYKTRILRLAVELNIEVTNRELQELRAQLIDEAVEHPAKLPKYPERPKMRADFEQAFQANMTPAQRAAKRDCVIVAAVTQAAEDKGYPNILIDPNGQKGILQNLIEFNTYAFAVVKSAEGISMTRVPTTATPELIQLIGTEVKLMTKEKQQLAEKERRAKEDSRSRANIR